MRTGTRWYPTGTRWITVRVSRSALASVSCPSVTFCAMVGSSGAWTLAGGAGSGGGYFSSKAAGGPDRCLLCLVVVVPGGRRSRRHGPVERHPVVRAGRHRPGRRRTHRGILPTVRLLHRRRLRRPLVPFGRITGRRGALLREIVEDHPGLGVLATAVLAAGILAAGVLAGGLLRPCLPVVLVLGQEVPSGRVPLTQ